MFTYRKLALSSLREVARIEVVRDAQIAFAGKIPTPLPYRVVPAAKTSHLESAFDASGISAFVVPSALASQVPDDVGLAISEDPQAAVARAQAHLAVQENFQWESFPSRVDPTAVIENTAFIAPKDVIIGAGCYVGPQTAVLERSVLGTGCSIGAGTVIGADAFDQMHGASPARILPQSGGVKLEDHVTIQSKCTIVRATFGGFTTLGSETMLDCQVHVAHDCQIGKRVKLTACSEISGRVEIGDDSFLGPNCSISNGVKIGKSVHVTIGSVVVRDVEDGQRVSGNFALPHQKWLNFVRTFR